MENWAPFDVTTSNVVLGSSGWFDTKAPPTPPRPPNRPTEPAYLGVSLGWAPTTWQDWGAGSAAAPRARYIAPDTWVPFDVTAAAFVASSIGWMDQGVAPPRAAARLLMVDPTGASSNTSTLQTFLETPEQPRRTLPWPRPTEPGYFGLAQASLGPSTWVEWAAGSWAPRPFIDKPTDEAYFAATAIKGPTAWVDWGGAQREGRVYRAPQTDPAYLGLSLGWAPTSWLDWAGPPIAARASPRVPPDNWAPWSVTTAPAALATFPWQSDPVRTPAPKRQPEMAMPFFGTGDISPPALTAFQRWQDEPIPTKPPFPRPTPDAYFSGAAKLGPSGWVEWAVPYVVRAPRPNLQTEPAYLGVSLGWAPTSWVDWSGRDLAPARPPPWPRPTEPAFFSGQATLGPVRWVDWGPPYIVQPPGPKRPVATDYVPFDGLPAFVALPFWQPDRDRVPPAPRAWPTPDPWTGVPFVLSPRAWVQYSNEPTRPPYPPRFSENHTPIWPLTPPPTLGEFFDWSGEARPKPDPSPADLNATWSWLPIPNWAGGPLLFPPVPELQIGNAISPTVFICLVGNAVPIICTFFDLITQVETDPTSVFAVLESPDGTTQQLTLQRNGPGVYATVVLIQQPQDSIVRFTGVMGISPVSVEGTINAVAPATPGPAGPPTQSPPPPPAPIWTAVSFSTPLPFQMTPTVNEIAVDGRGGPVPLLVWQNPGPSDKFTVNDWYDASASGGVITVTSQDTSLIEDPGAPGTYKQTIHIADFSKFVGTWQYSAVFNQWGLKSR